MFRHGMPCVVAIRATSLITFMECTKVPVSVQSVRRYQLHLVRVILLCRMLRSRFCITHAANISLSLDTFNHITLEIPRVSKLDFVIVLMRDPGEDEPQLPIKYCVSVRQTGTVSDLIASLGSMSGIPASRLSICNVVIEKCQINQLYRYVQDLQRST
jgi:hypothetical protein